MDVSTVALGLFSLTFIATTAIAQNRAVAQTRGQPIVLANVNVVDTAGGTTENKMSILIVGDRIEAVAPLKELKVPRSARVIDCRDKFVMPGLADMHHHLGDGFNIQRNFKRNLAEMLRWGFTTIFSPGHSETDLASYTQLRTESRENGIGLPRFYGVGRSISVEGGHASDRGAFLPQVPEDVPRIIAEQKAAGADAIKLIYDDLAHAGLALPTMRPDVMAAIVRESHKAGLKAYVHAPQLKYAKEVLRAGADGLVHAIIDAPVDDDFIALMKNNQALYVTTHSVRRAFLDLPRWADSQEKLDVHRRIPQAVYDNLKRRRSSVASSPEQYGYLKGNLRKVYDAGILVVAGTDTAVPGVLLGISSQMELVALVEDGLTPHEAVRAATVNAAKMLGREADLGAVKAGKMADLLILDKDPLKDISNIRFIHLVLKGGLVYEASALRNADKWGL